MEPDTDSLLFDLWNKRQGKTEEEFIERRWEDIIIRRRHGELTDNSRCDAAKKIISDSMRLHGISVTMTIQEGSRIYRKENDVEITEMTFSWLWNLMAISDLHFTEQDGQRWERLVDKISTEMATLPFILYKGASIVNNWCVMDSEKTPELEHLPISEHPMRRKGAAWR